MEVSTIAGLVIAVVFIGLAIREDIAAFVHINSMMIVLGGTLGSLLIRYPVKTVLRIISLVKKTFLTKLESPDEMIRTIINLSVEAKKNGILGLEKVQIENPFLKKGIQLAIDGVEPELIDSVLSIDIATTTQRHENGKAILVSAGDAAPAFGMIGTLIGLVLMLGSMDDPKAIDPGMAVAIITTLYGSLMANVIFLPLADKLGYFHEQEMVLKQLILSGILSIANGDHPAVVQEKLSSFLNPASRRVLEESIRK